MKIFGTLVLLSFFTSLPTFACQNPNEPCPLGQKAKKGLSCNGAVAELDHAGKAHMKAQDMWEKCKSAGEDLPCEAEEKRLDRTVNRVETALERCNEACSKASGRCAEFEKKVMGHSDGD